MKVVVDAGGADKVTEGLVRLKKLEEGTGKPPCLFDLIEGKRKPRSVGRVEVTDSHVVFRASTPELVEVLSTIGATYEDVQELPLGDFRRRFARLRTRECRYQLDVQVSTQLLAPMDTIWSAFSSHRL